MPDLGVDWPDLNAKELEPPVPVTGPKGQADASAVTDENSEIRYTVEVEGLSAIGNSEELPKAFRKQSALQADRKDPANAAQIGRRSSADATCSPSCFEASAITMRPLRRARRRKALSCA